MSEQQKSISSAAIMEQPVLTGVAFIHNVAESKDKDKMYVRLKLIGASYNVIYNGTKKIEQGKLISFKIATDLRYILEFDRAQVVVKPTELLDFAYDVK